LIASHVHRSMLMRMFSHFCWHIQISHYVGEHCHDPPHRIFSTASQNGGLSAIVSVITEQADAEQDCVDYSDDASDNISEDTIMSEDASKSNLEDLETSSTDRKHIESATRKTATCPPSV